MRSTLVRALIPAALLTGCVEADVARLPPDAAPYDAARPDASGDAATDATGSDAAADASGDMGSDGSTEGGVDASVDGSMDAGRDAGTDAGTTSYCTPSSTVVLTTVSAASSLAPSAATYGDQLVVAWVETRSGFTDLFVRRVQPTGAAEAELQVTADATVESEPFLVPSGTGMLLAYVTGAGTSAEIATSFVDPLSLTVGSQNPITTDSYEDASPVLVPYPSGASLFFQHTVSSPAYLVEALEPYGSSASAPLEVSSTRSLVAPIAVDATATDPRLYYVASTTTLGSIAITTFGVETSPDPGEVLITRPGSLQLGARIRTTPADATPRVVLAAATAGTRPTAMLQRMSSAGAKTGSAIELVSTRSVVSPAITAFGGYALVAYRSGTTSSGEARIALLRSNGTIAADFVVASLASIAGSLEIVALADGSGVDLVLDDQVGSSRELRVMRLACALP